LDLEIIDIENEISTLQNRLRLLQRRRANHASYISSLRRLPPEILVEIVYMCLYGGVNITTLTQICGNIRDAITGMSSLWSHIKLVPPKGGQYVCWGSTVEPDSVIWISGGTTEQLELILTRSGSNPLDLFVQPPLDSELLGPILSRNSRIKSLKIVDWAKASRHPADYESIGGLNMDLLESLILNESWMQVSKLLLPSEAITHVEHQDLKGHIDAPKISLPQARYIEISSNQNLYNALDLTDSKAHTLKGVTRMRDRLTVIPSSFPNQLTRLFLVSVYLGPKPVQTLLFPHLVGLIMADVTMQGVLGEYFEAPSLKVLYLSGVDFDPLSLAKLR
ncbi:5924_t:CDS:2, partial [Acaulospora colombiana]